LILTLVTAIFLTEFIGYGLHQLLHSDRFPALSGAHLIHHFLLYGPTQPMRTPEYKNATEGRVSIDSVGWEWLLPSALVLAAFWELMQMLRVPPLYEFLALTTMLAWPIFMFSYLHDCMHLKDFWMARTPLLRTWFLRARRLHDIHHHSMNDQGYMNCNFGIGFFVFDRIFRSLAKRHCPFNWRGYHAARRRYKISRADEDDLPDFPSHFRV
jgi:sterol desaturase/sphingolipid hydroxylase (fatty acid hydroxylase superfamily)